MALTDPQAVAQARLELVRDKIQSEHNSVLPALEPMTKFIEHSLHEAIHGRDGASGPGFDWAPVVRTRVKSLGSALRRLEEHARDSLVDIPDMVGARVVVLDRSDVPKILAALDGLAPDGFRSRDFDGGVGRNRGFSGRWVDNIPLGRFSELLYGAAREEQPVLSPDIADLKLDVQVQTVLQETWLNLSHRSYYKSTTGVPRASSDRLRRLAPVLDLVDGEISNLLARTKADQSVAQVRLIQAISEHSLELIPLDELYLKELSQLLPQEFNRLRELGRRVGMQHSGWTELVRVGDETEICISLCESTGVSTIGQFRGLLSEFVAEGSVAEGRLRGMVNDIAEAHLPPPFDRPLLVFALARLVTSSEIPPIPSMAQPLWKVASKWRDK